MVSVDFASGMRRCVLAGCLSLLAHLLPAILLSSLSLLEKLLPPPPITWDIVPAKRKTPPPLIAPEAVAAKPLVPDPPEPAQKQQLSRRGEPGGKIGKPTPPKTPPLASLHGVGAASIEQDVGLRLVLRMAEVARSPHRQSVAGLLGAFPDSRLLVAGSALSSGDELAQELFSLSDVLVIATTDPTGYRRSATALLAMGKKLRPLFDKLTARRVPTWDDRELLFDAPDLLAFLPRPEPLPSPPSDGQNPDASVGPEPPSLTSQLPALRRALPKQGPPLVVEIFNVQGRLRLRGGIPTPRHIQLALSSDMDPQVHGRLVVSSAEEATQLRAAILQVGDKLRSDWRFKLMGISTVLDHLQIEVKASELLVEGFVTGAALRSLLGVATTALQVLPSGAPPPPPDFSLPPAVDAGVDAQ